MLGSKGDDAGVFLVDNSVLGSSAPGLGVRGEKELGAFLKKYEYLPWGSKVRGRLVGAGWLRLEGNFKAVLHTPRSGLIQKAKAAASEEAKEKKREEEEEKERHEGEEEEGDAAKKKERHEGEEEEGEAA